MSRQAAGGGELFPLLLAVELQIGSRRVSGRTAWVTSEQALIRTNETVPSGATAKARFSFPSLLSAIEVEARIEAAEDVEGMEPFSHMLHFASSDLRGLLQSEAAPVRGEPLAVLLVDDSVFISQVFSVRLSRYSVDRPNALALSYAGSAEAAWQRLRQEAFRVAVVEHHLPEASGAHLIRRIRESGLHRDLGLIAMSADGEGARRACREAGAGLFLPKPIDVRRMLYTLDHLQCRARSPFRPSRSPG